MSERRGSEGRREEADAKGGKRCNYCCQSIDSSVSADEEIRLPSFFPSLLASLAFLRLSLPPLSSKPREAARRQLLPQSESVRDEDGRERTATAAGETQHQCRDYRFPLLLLPLTLSLTHSVSLSLSFSDSTGAFCPPASFALFPRFHCHSRVHERESVGERESKGKRGRNADVEKGTEVDVGNRIRLDS